jgi:serine protease SohB
MEVLFDVAAFAAKGFVVLVVVAFSAALIFRRRGHGAAGEERGSLGLIQLNDRWQQTLDGLRAKLFTPKDFKRYRKERKAQEKAQEKAQQKAQKTAEPGPDVKPKLFILDFKGDLMAHAVESLRREVSALIAVAQPSDEVVVRLESPGGAAHAYGFAASQLARFSPRGIKLTVCVDRIAASGGYMMACVADHIVAAPFALIGSIGVAAPVPNIHRLLDRHGVDYENITAGKYKRTVSFLAENTDEGRAKFQQQIEETHTLFKDFVSQHRSAIDIDAIATGEYWHATRAAELGLVDELATSDDYLMAKLDEADIFELKYHKPESLRDRLTGAAAHTTYGVVDALWSRARTLRWL